MSISKNYKKNIPVTDLQYYYYVCYEALNQNPQFHYDENVKFYKNTYRLLDENFNLIIDDRETREKAKNLIFFYSMYDKNIYSINKLTSIHLNNYDSIFYTKHKLFINCVILIISGDDCAMGCYLEGELVAHKRFHRYIVRGAGKSQIRHDDESGYRTKGSAGTNLRRYNAKEMDSDIRTLLKTWNQQLKLVKVVFYQGAAVHRGAVLSYFKDSGLPVEKLPFQMAARTGGVKHAYEELFRVTCHGTVNQFFHDLEENTLCHIPEPSFVDEEHSVKWKDAKEEQRRKVKDQRKAKRESRRVVY
ncbi:unnamed protein product [Auanema sp. JU1783]|nr:unnamed protein product [Auanema sp. JU1783]